MKEPNDNLVVYANDNDEVLVTVLLLQKRFSLFVRDTEENELLPHITHFKTFEEAVAYADKCCVL